jgi:Sulfotransferase family
VACRAAAQAGAGWVIDSSKTSEQLRVLSVTRPEALRVIFLVRDGRGVALSKAQRRGRPFWWGVVSWMTNTLRLLMALRSVPAAQRLTVRYEALCADPEREMRRIAEFTGLPFDPAITRLLRDGRHNIGGSPHRFDSGPAAIRLDDRWHGLVRGWRAVQFGLMGGWLNALLGYRRR